MEREEACKALIKDMDFNEYIIEDNKIFQSEK